MSSLARAVFYMELFILLLILVINDCRGQNVTDPASTELGSGNDDITLVPQMNPFRCIPLSEAVESNFIFDVCLSYFPPSKQFFFDYREEYQSLTRTLTQLNNMLEAAASIAPFCTRLLRAYTCNYVYPGCSNETGLPQGICTEECQRYVLTNVCRQQFLSLQRNTQNTGSAFTRQCDNTLFLLEEYGIGADDFDHRDCINITDQIFNEVIMTSTAGMISTAMGTTSTAEVTSTADVTSAAGVTKSVPSANTVTVATLDSTNSESTFDQSILIGALLPVFSIILLVLLAVTIIISTLWKAKKKKKEMDLEDSDDGLTVYNHYQAGLTEGDHHDYAEVALDLFHLSEEDVHDFITNDKLRRTLIPMESLYITGEIGKGAFGRVFKGFLQIENAMNDGKRIVLPVAIKTIKNTQGMYTELKAFIEESALMCSFNHPHVLGMVGICLDTVQSPYLLLPYMANGDLRTFLRNKRESSKNSDNGYPEGLDYNLLVRMCYEVATGMEYLASKKLVHRDLAARNCMVDQDFSVKVADFGLARVIYQTDYYRQHQQVKVPVKWMAPESLHDMISTEKSDVWSYGVVCWEVFSLGRLPYPTLANQEVVDYLERGNRLKKPALCSDIIYELMLKCWEERADNRPTFAVIVSQYHNGLIPGTAKTEEGDIDGYVLLGPEEMNSTAAQHPQRDSEEKHLSNTSVMDITIVNDHCEDPVSPSVGGTTFNVTLLHGPKGSDEPGIIASQLDKEEYVEMSAAVSNVLVNPAAHEHDGISDDEGSHVTSSADHVISDVDRVTPVEHELNYVIMQEADPAQPINQK